MKKGRLEAFSDGVIAIIITIMVLELKVPHGGEFESLKPLLPVLMSYILSFIYLGIYWNNHHHLLHAAEKITGGVLWANLHLLFWLSLVPFVTAWMGENQFAPATMSVYGIVLLMAGVAYWILQRQLMRVNGENSLLTRAVGKDLKGKASPFLYLLGIFSAFTNEWISGGIYLFVALMWLIPDTRIERILSNDEKKN
jgi:uncharacterized membrane protein